MKTDLFVYGENWKRLDVCSAFESQFHVLSNQKDIKIFSYWKD